jgi:hypothetical protein
MKKALTTVLLLGAAFLLFRAFGWQIWVVRSSGGARYFKVATFETNGLSGVGIADTRYKQWVWVKWNQRPEKESFYFRGEPVLDVWSTSNRPPVYGVYFHGRDKEMTMWQNRGGGSSTFAERSFYDTNGDLSLDEVLYKQEWHPVERRDGKNGIILDGRWCQLGFDTNGMWTLVKGAE